MIARIRTGLLKAGVAAFLLALSVTSLAAPGPSITSFTEAGLTVTIDGFPVEFDPAPYVLPPGRAMVPMRAFFEALGATVTWENDTRTVTAVRGSQVVVLQIGSEVARVNNQEYRLDVVPEIRHNRTFIPLRFVSEALSHSVSYEPSAGVIAVRSNPAPMERLRVKPGMKFTLRIMLVNLFLMNQWNITVEEAAQPPGSLTYTFSGTLFGTPLPLMRRHLTTLESGRKFMPEIIEVAETETMPWLSAQVFRELKSHGRSDRFRLGGFSATGQKETSLTVTGATRMAFSLDGRRVDLPVLVTATPDGDRIWVLDDAANPLVVKFQPVGVPLPGRMGTVGYQVERIDTE